MADDSTPTVKEQLQAVSASAKLVRTDGMAASLETIATNTTPAS